MHSSPAAFSLVEVAMALGIMGFAFVAILGLVPVALNSFRDSKAAAVSSQISEQIIAQAQVAPFSALTQGTTGTASTATRLLAPPETPASAHPNDRYFNDQGVEVLSTDVTGIYQANTRVLVNPPFVQSVAGGGAAINNADVVSLTVQVAYNPGRFTLNLSGTQLYTGTVSGGTTIVPIASFQTNVARNF